jgi:hypothetical protein
MWAITSTSRNSNASETAGREGLIPRQRAVLTAAGAGVKKAAAKTGLAIAHVMEAFAQARLHRAAIEAELYLGRYKHSSKNDDDLPIAR